MGCVSNTKTVGQGGQTPTTQNTQNRVANTHNANSKSNFRIIQ